MNIETMMKLQRRAFSFFSLSGWCLLVFACVLLLLFGVIFYEFEVKTAGIDRSVFPDGKQSVELLSVGSPFLFGSAKARLVMKNGSKETAAVDFEVDRDELQVDANDWKVAWKTDCVDVTVFQVGHSDVLYSFFFDGTVKERALDSLYGKLFHVEDVISE